MNAPFDPAMRMSDKFAVGQPVSRKEDPMLLRGEGRYSDDLSCPGQLYAVMVRSRMAHGELRAIDEGLRVSRVYLSAARCEDVGRPVKWTDERSESFVSDSHGRDHEMTAELALDAQGRFLALRVNGFGNLGAWLSNATTIPATLNTSIGQYLEVTAARARSCRAAARSSRRAIS